MIKKILLGVGIVIALCGVFIGGYVLRVRATPPPQLVANVMNLEHIARISKYRGCVGHTTVPQDERESARSMKIYVDVKQEFAKANTVAIYAPYDGYVSILRNEPEQGLQGEIWLSPIRTFLPLGLWNFSVEHIIPREDLSVGSRIRAGEVLGYAAVDATPYGRTFDLVYGKLGLPPKRIDGWTGPFADLDFLFNHMTDEVFAEYEKHGIASRDMLYISKEERDEDPCVYQGDGPYFEHQAQQNDWVILE